MCMGAIDVKNVYCSAGDNILTAVNVAKSCGMVGCHERVIFVNATPHTASSVPTLTFNLEDEGQARFQSSADVFTQVGDVMVQYWVMKVEFMGRRIQRSGF